MVYQFIEKLQNPLSELQIKSYYNIKQIYQNWRGYESYRSWVQYKNGNIINYLLGSGFGSKIDIGFNATLNNQSYSKILVTHNGYLYLLAKTGFIGLLSYLSFISISLFTSFKINRSTDDQLLKLLSKLSISLIMTVTLITFVVSGFVSKGNSSIALIIFGYIAAFRIKSE